MPFNTLKQAEEAALDGRGDEDFDTQDCLALQKEILSVGKSCCMLPLQPRMALTFSSLRAAGFTTIAKTARCLVLPT